MAVATQKFERKGKGTTYLHGWYQRIAGAASVLLIVLAGLHFVHRLGVEWAGGWDLIGLVIGFKP